MAALTVFDGLDEKAELDTWKKVTESARGGLRMVHLLTLVQISYSERMVDSPRQRISSEGIGVSIGWECREIAMPSSACGTDESALRCEWHVWSGRTYLQCRHASGAEPATGHGLFAGAGSPIVNP